MKPKSIIPVVALLTVISGSSAANTTQTVTLPPFDENAVNVITNQPEGEVKYFSRSGFEVNMTEEGPVIQDESNSLICFVFGEDGEVWIKDPVSNDKRDSWVKGEMQPDNKTVTVETGQFTDYMPSLLFGRQLWVLDYNPSTDMYSVNPEIKEITYTLSDGKIELEGTSRQRIIGSIFRAKGETEEEYHYEGTWSGYGNYGSVYTVYPDAPSTIPPSASKETITFRAPAYTGGQWSMIVKEATLARNNHEIYLSGFCSSGLWFTQDEWVIKGYEEDGKIVFPSGQFLGEYYGNPYYMIATDKDGTAGHDVVFTLSDSQVWSTRDRISFSSSASADADYSYFYYEGATLSNLPLPALVTPPVAARQHLYKMTYKGYIQSIDFYYDSSTNVTVATSGNKIYIKGLYFGAPEGWIEGDITGNKAIFKSPQYLGNQSGQYPELWFMSFSGESNDPTDTIEFDYDNTTGSLSNASANISIAICEWMNLGLQWFFNPSLDIIETEAATPANPLGLKWKTYDWDPVPTFAFEIPVKDIDDNDLVRNWLYYRIYTETDGIEKLFTMYPDEYPDMNLSEPINLFPYNYIGSDISWTAGTHDVNMRGDLSDVSRIGVQSLYDAGGEERTSEIIWLELPQSGLENVTAHPDYEDGILYNLQGQKVTGTPVPGIYIRNGKKTVIR